MDSNSSKFQIISIILLFLLFLISEYIGNKLFQLSLVNNLTGLLILVIALLVYFTSIGYFTRTRLQKEICKELGDMKESIGKDISNLSLAVDKISIDWLLTHSEINTIEKSIIKEMEIWIITPDLKNDTKFDDPQIMEIIEIVKKNMAKGVKYTYIIPDNDDFVRAKTKELNNIFIDFKNTNKLSIVRIDKDHFSLLGNMCFVIYNPGRVKDRPSKVYLELPQKEKKWWIQISDDQATLFEGRIAGIIERRT